uniref:Uncharacterized protein n=1 Tax=Romanomermis culicivorax TaxID=13658 RepID=A0A915I7U0_ROMCU
MDGHTMRQSETGAKVKHSLGEKVRRGPKYMLASNKSLPSTTVFNLHKNISGVPTFFLIFVEVACLHYVY